MYDTEYMEKVLEVVNYIMKEQVDRFLNDEWVSRPDDPQNIEEARRPK